MTSRNRNLRNAQQRIRNKDAKKEKKWCAANLEIANNKQNPFYRYIYYDVISETFTIEFPAFAKKYKCSKLALKTFYFLMYTIILHFMIETYYYYKNEVSFWKKSTAFAFLHCLSDMFEFAINEYYYLEYSAHKPFKKLFTNIIIYPVLFYSRESSRAATRAAALDPL